MYQDLPYQKTWEREMFNTFNEISNWNSEGLQYLYSTFQYIAAKHLAKGSMKEGDKMMIPTSARTNVEFIFYKDYTLVNARDRNGRCMELIKKDMPQELKERFIYVYEETLHQGNYGIGYPYPPKLKEKLKDMIVGETIVFEKGQMYICSNNSNGIISLMNPCGEMITPSLSKFALEKKININLNNDGELQAFYDEVRNKDTGSISGLIVVNNEVQKKLNEIYSSLTDERTKLYQFGPIELRVKRRVIGKGIIWYDSKGTKIPEEKVKCLLAWLNTSPVVTEFAREVDDYETHLSDLSIKEQIELYYQNNEFEAAYKLLETYCIENQGSLTIDVKSYVKNEKDEYIAMSYIFKENNGMCDVFCVQYENNDFAQDIVSMKKVSKTDFIKFCTLKFTEQNLLIQQSVEQIILTKKPNIEKNELDKLVEKIKAKKSLSKGVKETKKEVTNLLDSYDGIKRVMNEIERER